MNKLQETWNQIRDLYAGMPPGTRVVAVLLTAVLLVSLLFLVLPGKGMPSAPKNTFLYGDYVFSQSEQMAVISALGSAGLKDHDWEGYRLKVPVKKAELYAAALSKAKVVPQDVTDILVDTAQNTSPLITQADRNDKKFAAMLQATSRTIRKLNGVEDASVTGDSSKILKDLKHQRQQTFSVTVLPMRNREVDKRMRAAIVGIVKDSFGTNAENITIIDASGRGGPWKGSEDWFGDDNGLLEKKRDEEFAFEQKIISLLSDIDDLKVTASAIVDKYKSWEQLKIEHDKKTIIASDEESRKIDAKGGYQGGRPGYEVQDDNVPLPIRRAVMNGTLEYKDNQSRAREYGVLPGSENQIQYAPFPLLGISASIRVPYTYFMKTLLQMKKVRGEDVVEVQEGEIDTWITQEITRLKKQLYPHLRTHNPLITDDVELDKLITIEPYHTQELVPLPELTAWQNLSAWFGDNWKTMGLFVLVTASLGVLWGATRPQKPEPIIIYEAPEMSEVDSGADEDDEEDEEGGAKRSLEPFNKSMRSLQEEVSELVVENPDAAASVLRQWIGRVEPQEQK